MVPHHSVFLPLSILGIDLDLLRRSSDFFIHVHYFTCANQNIQIKIYEKKRKFNGWINVYPPLGYFKTLLQ